MQPHCLKFFSLKYGSGYTYRDSQKFYCIRYAGLVCMYNKYIHTYCLSSQVFVWYELYAFKIPGGPFKQIQCGRIAKTRRGNFLPFMFLPICIRKDFESQRQLFTGCCGLFGLLIIRVFRLLFWVIVNFLPLFLFWLFRAMSNFEIVKSVVNLLQVVRP